MYPSVTMLSGKANSVGVAAPVIGTENRLMGDAMLVI
jgi:hypothetical protein